MSRTLWLAVIEQAVHDATRSRGTSNCKDVEIYLADKWLNIKSQNMRKVCEYAGISPTYLIDNLGEIKERVGRGGGICKTPDSEQS